MPKPPRHRHPARDRPVVARGRHAAPPAFPVLPEAVKDAAGVLRELTADAQTLTAETWRLLGRHRQQQLLAALAAAGLVLVMMPMVRQVDVELAKADDAKAAAASGTGDRSATRAAARATRRPAPSAGRHRSPEPPGSTAPARPVPRGSGTTGTTTTPGTITTPEPEPTVAVPPGNGPARSLRTTGSHQVALTFDDGPDPIETPKILALLAEYHVQATFCLIGRNVQRHPEIVREIVAAGHTLCNHTWDHSLTIGRQAPSEIRADLERTNAAIRAAVPGAKIPFFRAPGGNFTDRLVGVAYEEGMTSLYWQVDPRDWDHTADADDVAHVDRVVAAIEDGVRPGAIILSHDYHQPDTIDAYRRLLPYLKKHFTIGRPVPPTVAAGR